MFAGFEEGFEEDSGELGSVVLGRLYPLFNSASAGLLGCVRVCGGGYLEAGQC